MVMVLLHRRGDHDTFAVCSELFLATVVISGRMTLHHLPSAGTGSHWVHAEGVFVPSVRTQSALIVAQVAMGIVRLVRGAVCVEEDSEGRTAAHNNDNCALHHRPQGDPGGNQAGLGAYRHPNLNYAEGGEAYAHEPSREERNHADLLSSRHLQVPDKAQLEDHDYHGQ